MEELLSIKGYFKSANLFLTDDFLLAVKKFYTETKGAAKLVPLRDFVFYQWLHYDISQTVIHKSLPLSYPKDGKLLINRVFQINYAKRIDLPLYDVYTELCESKADLAWYNNRDEDDDEGFISPVEFSSSKFEKNRVLLMELTDGRNIVHAMEKEPISGLKTIVTPGTKIAIHGRVFVSNGVLYINNSLATVLGGDVEELYKRNNIKSVIERTLRLPESYKTKIKQNQDSKKKRFSLPEPSEASKEIMKQWLNKARESFLDSSSDSKSLYGGSNCSRDYSSSVSSIADELIDTTASYGSSVISGDRDTATPVTPKAKKNISDLFRPILNKIKKPSTDSLESRHDERSAMKRITGYFTPMKKKFGLTSSKKKELQTIVPGRGFVFTPPNDKPNFSNNGGDILGNIQNRDSNLFKTPEKCSSVLLDKENISLCKTPVSKSEAITKRGLSLRKPSEENILKNKKNKRLDDHERSSSFKKLNTESHYNLEKPSNYEKLSNSSIIPRLFHDNQSPRSSSCIIPPLDKNPPKRGKGILPPGIPEFARTEIYQGQDRYDGFKEDRFPNVINFNAKSSNAGLSLLDKRRSLNISASKNSNYYSDRHSYMGTNENLQFASPKSYSMFNDSCKAKSNSHSNISVMNMSNHSSDFGRDSPIMSFDKSNISLTQTPLFVKKRERLNTSNNSDAFFTPPNKVLRFDNTQQERPQLYPSCYTTIGEAKRKMDASFGAEILDIRAKVIRITKQLTIQNNQWTMEVEIVDRDENSLICPIHDRYISKFLGEQASESSSKYTQEINEKKKFLCKQLSRKEDLIFSIEMFPTQSIKPTIKNIRTVQQVESKASQAISQYTSNYI
uniref:RecQ-mediated genome instability protein 1 n=1 Tax=Strongyloides papillosus TaxID=174720 RepID=A0A0N5BMW5_STREA